MSHAFLQNLALVLCVAGITTVLCQWIRQPVVLGYLLAGVLVGPHVAFPLFADHETIETLSELGVILLMFSVGLEFNLKKLARLIPTAGLVAVIQIGLMIVLGFLAGWCRLNSRRRRGPLPPEVLARIRDQHRDQEGPR